jgi:hypothetical protein
MNQANQQVVLQNANMTLIQIRQYELGYFQTFFSNFGTQAALMIGFILGSISQVPGWDNPPDCPYFFIALYWVTSAICACCGMHCLVCTVLIQVYGQGLALRGPPGSMVRAIKGMIAEQEQILIAFLITIFTFGLQCIGMYFIMMDGTSAIAASVITVIFMIGWYRYALRLYNRFSWSNINIDWLGDSENDKDPTETLEELNPTVVNELHARNTKFQQADKKSMADFQKNKKPSDKSSKRLSTKSSTNQPTSAVPDAGHAPVNISDKVSVIDGVDHHTTVGNSNQNYEEIQSVLAGQGGKDVTQQDLVEIAKEMTFGSYLTLKERGRLGRENWVRRYFIIKGHHIFYYQDKRSFELNPSKPINKRAIDLEGYTLVAGSMNPPYPISLVPYEADDIRKVWKFQCDTEAEFERWIQLFSIALQSCNPSRQQGDLVMIADGRTEVVSVKGGGLGESDYD